MYNFFLLVKNQSMKNGWSDKEIKCLFDLVEKNNEQNMPVMKSFEIYAKKSNKNKLTVRNFYYSFVKLLKNNDNLAKKLDIDLSKHQIQKFEHFDDEQEKQLVEQIECLANSGYSVREACQRLSGGDIKKMIRLQNKYQNFKQKCKIIAFPEQKNKKNNQKLSDNEINSLFLGLVKLVREQAFGESEQKVKQYLEVSSQEKRKHVVDNQQKELQIEILKQQINELKEQNKNLNNQLKSYRINYVKNLSNNKNDSQIRQ